MGEQLDKLLRCAAADTLDGEDEAHALLMKECSWYQAVSDGENPGDPEARCKPADGKPVKLTPETPEASTVPEPTVPPGGPGLFHIKGRELPPYLRPALVAPSRA